MAHTVLQNPMAPVIQQKPVLTVSVPRPDIQAVRTVTRVQCVIPSAQVLARARPLRIRAKDAPVLAAQQEGLPK